MLAKKKKLLLDYGWFICNILGLIMGNLGLFIWEYIIEGEGLICNLGKNSLGFVLLCCEFVRGLLGTLLYCKVR